MCVLWGWRGVVGSMPWASVSGGVVWECAVCVCGVCEVRFQQLHLHLFGVLREDLSLKLVCESLCAYCWGGSYRGLAVLVAQQPYVLPCVPCSQSRAPALPLLHTHAAKCGCMYACREACLSSSMRTPASALCVCHRRGLPSLMCGSPSCVCTCVLAGRCVVCERGPYRVADIVCCRPGPAPAAAHLVSLAGLWWQASMVSCLAAAVHFIACVPAVLPAQLMQVETVVHSSCCKAPNKNTKRAGCS